MFFKLCGIKEGGDGGRGGDVILECSAAVWDFRSLQHHVVCAIAIFFIIFWFHIQVFQNDIDLDGQHLETLLMVMLCCRMQREGDMEVRRIR